MSTLSSVQISLAVKRRLLRIVSIGLTGLTLCLYVILLYWFHATDFYRQHFFDPGLPVVFYQLARLAFIPYMLWLVYAVGAGAIALTSGRAVLWELPAYERYPLGFLAGAGIWHLTLFVLGLNSLYIYPLAVGITVAVMVLSFPHLTFCMVEALSRLKRSAAYLQPQHGLLLLTISGIVVASGLFLFTKGLYPAGGHDYYNHYFPFYKRVVQSGSILPNEVWYHFFYSKGAGLYFLAMLLTDPLAPQLVATGFVAAAACIVFALLRHTSPTGLLPWIGVFLYIAFFIFTPGPGINHAHGGWGDLEKMHELSAVMILGIIWVTTRLFTDSVTRRWPWILALHAAIVTLALLTLSLIVLIGLYLTGILLWLAYKRRWPLARQAFAACVNAGFMLLGIMAVNYHYTGIPLDQGLTMTWPLIDLAKIDRWGVLLEVINVHWTVTRLIAESISGSGEVLWTMITFLRLELWWPIIVVALLHMAWTARKPEGRGVLRQNISPALPLLMWFALTVLIAAYLGGGLSQSISFYRMTTFSYAPMLCASLLLWHAAFHGQHWRQAVVFGSIALLATLILPAAIISEMKALRTHIVPILGNARNLATGRYSLLDAYQNQQGWPGRMPWGGVYPGLIEPWKIAGPHTPIWTFHIHSYCMLPDCNLQAFMSTRMSRQWQDLLIGSPEQQVKVFQGQGLNYFFFSKELQLRPMQGKMALFSPEQIDKFFAVRWTDGTSYLLTWPGLGTKPIDKDFLDAYQKGIDKAPEMQSFPLDDWQQIIAHLKKHGDNLKPFCLPWSVTCDGLWPLVPLDK